MPLSASVSSRGLLLCLYGRALFNGRFSRVCESPCKNTFWTATAFVTRDTFDAFLSYRAGIYPDLETESRCFRYLFYIECGIDTREKLAFWQNFVNLSSICSFFLNVYRFPSKTPPRLKFLPFHPIYFQYIYISYSTMKEFQTVSRICPLLLHLVLFPHLHFISRNNPPRKFRRGKYFVVKTVTKLVRISSALI